MGRVHFRGIIYVCVHKCMWAILSTISLILITLLMEFVLLTDLSSLFYEGGDQHCCSLNQPT